ncbi:MAG: DcaP family trimeric outer membrane transporter [Pseudomonadota bacterium]
MTPLTEKYLGSMSLKALLFSGVAMTVLCGHAGAQNTRTDEEYVRNLEDRVQALEAKLDMVLDRLGGDSGVVAAAPAGGKIAGVGGAGNTAPAAAFAGPSTPVVAARQTTQSPSVGPVLVELDTPGGVSAQSQPVKPTPKKDGLGVKFGDTDFQFTGYVKLDAIVSDFDGGELASSSIGRDFYIPALVPVGGSGDGPDFDFNPRETRYIFKVNSNRGGHEIGGLVELDFQVTVGGDERVSNSFIPRMRQAYITVDNWLFGQAWSTFQDVSALPDNLDFIGPTEGTVFNRQSMIRYSKGPWQIALEQPETEVTDPTGARKLPGDDIAPDVVLRYNLKRDWGHLTAAGIIRTLHVEDEIIAGAPEDTTVGYGLSVSGKLKVGERDDFRFMATAGDGIGRYIGVNVVNDVAIDMMEGELETIQTTSGFASYRHFWSPVLRSNLTGGYFKADNPIDLVGDGVTDRVYSIHANLIYTPFEKFDVGVEYIFANRRLESGLDGSLNRVQFSTKYSF